MMVKALCNVFSARQISLYAKSQLLKHNQYSSIERLTRMLSSHHVSKNIEFLSQDNRIVSSKNVTQINVTNNRPLLVILTWLLSKRRHVMKFVNLYMEQGFDVAVVSLTPWQLMWPVKGSRLVAEDLLTFLKQNESYQQILLHGFSVGAYMWGEALDLIQSNKDKYPNIADRIVGQVWDSIADVSQIAIGFPRAVFPKNMMLQSMLRKYVEYHMKTFHQQATQYYIRSSQVFHTASIIRVPALLFVSKTDPVGAVTSNLILRDTWESLGVKTYVKIFEESPHVAHFYTYPKEYITELYAFLQKLNLIQNEEKIRARL
ncbi:uncharacterized protein LOC105428505 [Pogonomyrmex barbatus]|uniref:Uncharacterized protein LOC105428505 n=1 Tax=Pogonomyrmex barbatus TaxID=144034 RepID=A0A6I9WA77_9HYME|nr:uncharacterized protein LOC105428505 [Pogonomyrmex barbatus]XP_011639163.1 uncharacterized protein LOC105428505 [Pogonomyrmex barbatus]XP_011639165.1 uncharacterized protein LOC105428505 [Pogonomyrmex barbatus]XP_011639166.1 uncharacterized protein LOC105428505 [Pogonomyrmex barbatus]XP_011639167.1 uncharacterized protein LOC105428505 [Pogonomyrmex barbatus]XP_011639168.1 uncharacterized protein LOC105428505 [Pogonomyrmex barbatus]XP_011639169.1 uncharacterized protein LOC105428505 [Pogono